MHQQIGDTSFQETQCAQCLTLWLVTTQRKPGFASWERIRCPICAGSLGEFRIDLSYDLHALALVRHIDSETWLNLRKGDDGQFWIQTLRGEDGDELVAEVACPTDRLRECLEEQVGDLALADDMVKHSWRLRSGSYI